MANFRILHSSDWHIGKRLFDVNRYDEFEQFLSWLVAVIIDQKIDALLVSGDVFDTMTPSNEAQRLYYGFLQKMLATPCKNIIITAGNHDSPTFLDAPKALLQAMNIHIIGKPSNNIDDEIIPLYKQGQIQAVVVATPYLRDGDVRRDKFGESFNDKHQRYAKAVQERYQNAHQLARFRYPNVPIVAMGHLFVVGASISSDDDGMRHEVGTLGDVSNRCFDDYDYVALGHIHKMQSVDAPHIRYSGSPIAMGFGESGHQKYVLLVDFNHSNTSPIITPLAIPIFYKLIKITGNLAKIKDELINLHHNATQTSNPTPIWVYIEFVDNKPNATLYEDICAISAHLSPIFIVKIDNKSSFYHKKSTKPPIQIDEINPNIAFDKFLADKNFDDDYKIQLKNAYNELLLLFYEEDNKAL